jgi:hypothetical protein
MSYDKLGNLLEERWYDNSLRSVLGPTGVNLVRHSYVDKHKKSTTHYNETIASPRLSLDFSGVAEERLQYNDRHQLTDQRFFGLNSVPIENSLGIHHQAKIYDRHGIEIEELFFNRYNKPTIGERGYYRKKFNSTTRRYEYYDRRTKLIAPFDPLSPDPLLYIQLPYIESITHQGSPAFRMGLRKGDVFWSYGNWSAKDALSPKGDSSNLRKDLMSEIRSQSQATTIVTVFRDRRLVTMPVPPLPAKLLGVNIGIRVVPKEDIKTLLTQ